MVAMVHKGFLGGATGKEPVCQCRRHKRCRFTPWGQEDPLEEGIVYIPVFLPGESYGLRNLVGYSPQGCEELDTTEAI